MTTLVLIAKECLPGKVKTRLHPPLTLEEAAEVAAASLADTLEALADLPATRRILLFDGNRPPLGSEPYDVIAQVSGTLDVRLGALFDLTAEPTVLIGMDTPQVTSRMLRPAFDEWADGGTSSDVDVFYGPADDGGYWTLGLRQPTGDLLRGVPMSQSDTGAHQLARLAEHGLRVRHLPELVDVDTIDDARVVAVTAPDTSFAATLRRVDPLTRDGAGS